MKEIIENNYLIEINNFFELENYCYFLYDGEYYYFVKTSFNESDINEIIKFLNNNQFLNKCSHKIILNNKGNYLTQNRVLLKINGLLDGEIDNDDLFKWFMFTEVKNNNNFVLWSKLWERKIDYLEYQIRELGKDKKIVLNSFSYFLALAENACSYVNKISQEVVVGTDDRFVLAHRRILYPNSKINFFNPLLYIIDLEVRDIASYIKFKFWSGADVWDDLDYFFLNKTYGAYSYHMFYARMLYPSYYFDIYEKIINGEVSENELINIINRIEEYELFLNKLKKYLSKYVSIFEISWLN